MMFQAENFFRALPRVLTMIVVGAAVLAALVIAWWVALVGVVVLSAWFGLRRLILHGADTPGGAQVIEGEFEKVEEPPERLR
ncbi:MAG TPA: hypothetical protein VFA72_09745 [Burkholderiales bacterium]|nr:hypothetical protein [Burkholderiales bacterium]